LNPAPTNGKPSKKDRLQQLHQDYPEIASLLKTHWLAHAELPPSSKSPSAKFRIADTIRLMHTKDGRSWDQIGQILEHAATKWVPKRFIGSPAALREMTKKGDQMTHEAIWGQIKGGDATSDNDMSEFIGGL
jgi:hypothetical protein